MCILGSGSRGNATLLTRDTSAGTRHALIDCGLSRRETNRRLSTLGLTIECISDILVTHCDRDHFDAGWSQFALKHNATIHMHRRQRTRALREGLDGRVLNMFEDRFTLDEETTVNSVLFAHDSLGTTGFVIEHDGRRLGFATDLGSVPSHIFEHFIGLHGIAFESNYDPQMQRDSDRPDFLKQRIMGGRGHLSNEQALRALRVIAGQSELSQIALLHLSQQCNDPAIIRALYEREAPELADRLTITSQTTPSPMLEIMRIAPDAGHTTSGEQLAMF